MPPDARFRPQFAPTVVVPPRVLVVACQAQRAMNGTLHAMPLADAARVQLTDMQPSRRYNHEKRAKPTCRSVVPVEPCWWPGGGDFLADPQEHDLEPVGIAHCYAVDFRVAMPVVRHLLPGQEFLGAIQFGGIPRIPKDARYPGFAR